MSVDHPQPSAELVRAADTASQPEAPVPEAPQPAGPRPEDHFDLVVKAETARHCKIHHPTGAPAPTPAQVATAPSPPEVPAPAPAPAPASADSQPPAALSDPVVAGLLALPAPDAVAPEALTTTAFQPRPSHPESENRDQGTPEASAAPGIQLGPNLPETGNQVQITPEVHAHAAPALNDDDDEEDPEGIDAFKKIFESLITILQLIPFFGLYVFLCGSVYKKSYSRKTIRSVGISTISALFIGTLDDLAQLSASFRQKNKETIEKRQGIARSAILLLLFLLVVVLLIFAEPEPTRCDCVMKPVDATLSWIEQLLSCDSDYPFEVFGGFVAFIVFGQSSIRKMSSIPHLLLLLMSAATHHFLLDNQVLGLITAEPLTYAFALVCCICCVILLSRTLPDNEKPKKEALLFFSKLRKDWKLIFLLIPFLALYLFLCSAVYKPNSPLKIIKSVGVSTISFLVFGTVDDVMQLLPFMIPTINKLQYKRAVRCLIFLFGLVICGCFYVHSSSGYDLYTCTCPEQPINITAWSVERITVYEIFAALLAYGYISESPVKDLPPLGHLPMLLLAFNVHVVSFDFLNLSTTFPLSVFSAAICVIYFLLLVFSRLKKTWN